MQASVNAGQCHASGREPFSFFRSADPPQPPMATLIGRGGSALPSRRYLISSFAIHPPEPATRKDGTAVTRCARWEIAATGLELPPESSGKPTLTEKNGTNSGTLKDDSDAFDELWITFQRLNVKERRQLLALARSLSLIHISEPTRQAEISYAVF